MGFAGSVAQRLEQGTHNPLVLGSNPSGPMFWWKVKVEGGRGQVEGSDSRVVGRGWDVNQKNEGWEEAARG